MSRILLVAFLAIGWSSGGCDRGKDDAVDVGSVPSEIEFEVDQQGVYYVTFGVLGTKQPAENLEDIPFAERGGVGVHVAGEMPEEMPRGRMYMTDLLEAEPGEAAEAKLTPIDAVRDRNEIGRRAARVGIGAASRAKRMAVEAAVERPDGDDEPSKTTETVVEETSIEIVQLDADEQKAKGESEAVRSRGQKVEIERLQKRSGKAAGAGRASKSTEKAEEGEAYRSVELFGTDWCDACTSAREWLDDNGVSYAWRNIEEPQAKKDMRQFCEKKGRKPDSLPTLRIGNNKIMQGWSPEKFRRLAAK